MQLQLTLGADEGVQRELRNRHSETEVWTTANVTTVRTRGVMVDLWEEPDKTGLPSSLTVRMKRTVSASRQSPRKSDQIDS